MQLKFGENLRALRQNAGITQDRLAEYLGITSQAVSRWESGICYPDLEFLPGIASYFHTTVDALLGCDRTEQEQNDAILTMSALVSAGKREEAVQFAHEKLALNPGNHALAVLLSSTMLLYGRTEKNAVERYREGELLCRRVLRDNQDVTVVGELLRITAKSTLSHLLLRQDKREDAIQIAMELPSFTSGQEFHLLRLQSPMEKSAYLASVLPTYLSMLTGGLIDPLTEAEENRVVRYSIAECRRTLAIWDSVYDAAEVYLGKDARYAPFLYGYLHFRLAYLLTAEPDAFSELAEALRRFVKCVTVDGTDRSAHTTMETIRKRDPAYHGTQTPAIDCSAQAKAAFFYDGYLTDGTEAVGPYAELWRETIEKLQSIRAKA